MTIKFADLKPTNLVQIVDLDDDHASDEGPDTGEPMTKDTFSERYLDPSYSITDWYEGSGDGGPNYVLVTVDKVQGIVAVVR